MKIFISSLIAGMEEHRVAAREAVEALGYEAIMAERFVAKPQTPQIACLDGLRQSGLMVLLLGANYGLESFFHRSVECSCVILEAECLFYGRRFL